MTANDARPTGNAARASRARASAITVSAVLNVQSGSLKGRDIDAFERRIARALDGPRFALASIDASGRPIDAALRAAVDGGSECLLVCGGDGSVSLAAATALEHDRLLAILPGGTMNLFARTLGVPLDLDDALASLATAEETTMDIATVNGTPFIHQFTVGLHADAVRLRDGTEALVRHGRLGKLAATARAFASVVLDPPRFPVTLREGSGEARELRLSALSVSNNPFGEGHLPYADAPDGGTLGLYRAAPLKPLAAMRLVADIVLGTHAGNADVTAGTTRCVELVFPDRWLARRGGRWGLRDGELVRLEPVNRIETHPGAVRVLRPAGSGPRGPRPGGPQPAGSGS